MANPANLDDYVGTYELAPGKRITVTRVQNHLFSRKGDGQPTELLPESPDLFFRAGAEGRRLFRRDSTGRVDALIDRRNNEDLLWMVSVVKRRRAVPVSTGVTKPRARLASAVFSGAASAAGAGERRYGKRGT